MSNLKKLGFDKVLTTLFPNEFDYIISRIFRTLDGFDLTNNVGNFLTSYTATKEEKTYKDFYFGFNPNTFMSFVVDNPDSLVVEFDKEENNKINVIINVVGFFLHWSFEMTTESNEWYDCEDVLEDLKRFILELFGIVSHVGKSFVGIGCHIKSEFEYEIEIFNHSLKQIQEQFFERLKNTNKFIYNFLRGAVILGFEVHNSKLGGNNFVIGLSSKSIDGDKVFLSEQANKEFLISILNDIIGENKVCDIEFIPHLDAKSQEELLNE